MTATPKRSLGAVFLLALLVILGACTTTPASTSSDKLFVVTTVAPITSIVENIGGARIRAEGVIPEGVDSHTFEPPPSTVRTLAQADLIVLNGLFLEEPTLRMAEASKKTNAVILTLADKTIARQEWQFDFSFPESQGRPNPHLWLNPWYALRYAELVAEQLAEQDSANASYYRENLSKFQKRIERLDESIKAAIATVPDIQRKLLTYHDSWAYFAPVYGMQVIGAVQPSGFSEPSAREVAQLIDQIRASGVPAVFGSEVFPSKVLEQIARESGAKFVDKLRDDTLPGSPGEPRHTYFGLMVENVETMVAALGGRPDALKEFDTRPVFEGNSGAVYTRG